MTTREKAQHRVALYFSTAGLGTCVSLVAQVKILPANVGDMGWEGLLKKEMATHSRTLSWEIPRTEVSGGPESMGLQKPTPSPPLLAPLSSPMTTQGVEY